MMSGFTVGTKLQSNSAMTVTKGVNFDTSHDSFSVPSPSSTDLHIAIDDNEDDIFNQDNQQLHLSSSTGDELLPTDDLSTEELSTSQINAKDREEEKHIALGQLEELEAAIRVHKFTRVDGRKTRRLILKSELAEEQKAPKRGVVGKRKQYNKRTSYTVRELKSFKNKAEVKNEKALIVNNNIETNNNEINPKMKEDSGAAVLGVIETNNVLESMKQQFLEDTSNLSDTTSVPSKRKRRPGRPKKVNSIPKVLETNSQNVNPLKASEVSPPKLPGSPELIPKREVSSPNGLPSPTDYYSRKNPLTKGLRGVRKSESGSESNASSPTKENIRMSPLSPTLSLLNQTWPQSPANLVPNGDNKSPLLVAATKVLSFQDSKETADKSDGDKSSSEAVNGASSHDVTNSSEETAETIVNGVGNARRSRGKRKTPGQTTSDSAAAKKTISTLIVDVHNTMNGEPQTVITPKPVVGNKKKKSSKNESVVTNAHANGKENEPNPLVPVSNDAPTLPVVPSASKPEVSSNGPSKKSTNIISPDSTPTVQRPERSGTPSSTNSNGSKENILSKTAKRFSNGSPAEPKKVTIDKRQRTMLDFTTKFPSRPLNDEQIVALLPSSPLNGIDNHDSLVKKSPASSKSPSPTKHTQTTDEQKSKSVSKSANEKLPLNVSNDSLPVPDIEVKEEPVQVKLEEGKELSKADDTSNFIIEQNIGIKVEYDSPTLNEQMEIDDTLDIQKTNPNGTHGSSELPKKKFKSREVENLFIDEGALTLLFGLQSGSRRSGLNVADDAKAMPSQTLHAETAKHRVLSDRKRKLSGTSSASSSSGKGAPPEPKRPRVEPVETQPKSINQDSQGKKKIGRPSNAELRRKRGLLDLPEKTSVPSKPLVDPSQARSVPPLKIKLKPVGDMKSKNASLSTHLKPKSPPQVPVYKIPKPGVVSRPSLPGASGAKPVIKKPGQPVTARKSLPAISATSITSLLKPDQAHSAKAKKGPGEVVRQSQRSSVRHNEANNFRDIILRKFRNFVQIILNPSTTKMKNSLNARVLRELTEALNLLKRDPSVWLILMTGVGQTFCQGIDLTSLQHSNLEIRKKNIHNLTRALREFLVALVQHPKMIIAGVNGCATGLGVTMLPLFDMVFASEKATFFLPYGILGQVPEGGSTYTFPHFFGKLQANKLFMGHKLTAVEAEKLGLVSSTLWSTTFMQELLPKVASLADQPASARETTKALVNHHLYTKLELSLESESRSLVQQWATPEFPQHCKRLFDCHHFQFQKPANLS